MFQRVFQRLGGDKFAARSLDQIFLAVGHRKIAVGIKIADIAGLEPVTFERGASLIGLVPVGAENRGAPHQNFSIVPAMRTSTLLSGFP